MADWFTRFMELSDHIATWSKDRSQGVAAVIVGGNNEVRSFGYNGFPRGVNDDVDERHERPEKYFWTEHAERNAIYNAARVGTPIDDCVMYTNWFPCIDCARAIIQSGIKRVVVKIRDMDHNIYEKEFKRGILMFREAGVEVVEWQRSSTK